MVEKWLAKYKKVRKCWIGAKLLQNVKMSET